MTIEQQLLETRDALSDLIAVTEDAQQKKVLKAQLKTLTEIIDKLVKAQVKSNTAQYVAVTDNLNKANAEIKEAIEDLSKIAQTIATVAKLIEVASKVFI